MDDAAAVARWIQHSRKNELCTDALFLCIWIWVWVWVKKKKKREEEEEEGTRHDWREG